MTEDGLDNINRLLVIFLETAKLQSKLKQDLSIVFLRQNVDHTLKSIDLKSLIPMFNSAEMTFTKISVFRLFKVKINFLTSSEVIIGKSDRTIS